MQSPRAVVDNLIVGHEAPASAFTHTRSVNVPGICVAVGDMVAALRRVAGDAVADRVQVELRPGDRPHRVDVAVELRAEAGTRARHAADADFEGIVRAYIADDMPARRNAGTGVASAHRRPGATRWPCDRSSPLDPAPTRSRATSCRSPASCSSAGRRRTCCCCISLDTLLAMAVMFAGLARHFMPPPRDDGLAARVNAEAGCVGVALFLAAFIAVPLGMPLFILFAGERRHVGVGGRRSDVPLGPRAAGASPRSGRAPASTARCARTRPTSCA